MILSLLWLACTGAHTVDAPPPKATPEVQVVASLVSDTPSLAPGEEAWVAARFDITEGWHLYWENPGETGLSTDAELSAPDGFEISPVHYPGPERFVSPGDITSYGYKDSAALLFRVRAPEDSQAPADLSAETSWLACKDVCIKGSATITLAWPSEAAELSPYIQRLPKPFDTQKGATLTWSDDRLSATLLVPGPQALELFPSAELERVLAGADAGEDGRSPTLTLRFKQPQDALPAGVLRLTPRRGDASYLSLPESTS